MIEHIIASKKYYSESMEQYLCARFAHNHRLHHSFICNSFWAIVGILLSRIRLYIHTKEELLSNLGSHKLDKFWEYTKDTMETDLADTKKIGKLISRFNSHLRHRYPDGIDGSIIYYTGEQKPNVRDGDGNNVIFDCSLQLSLNDLDFLYNKLVMAFGLDSMESLGEYLASKNAISLYRDNNRHSIINKFIHDPH